MGEYLVRPAGHSRDPELRIKDKADLVEGIYFLYLYLRKKQRLAVGEGGNIHIAQMNAAERALIECTDLFPTFGNKEKVFFLFRRVSARHYGPAPLITPSRSSLPSLLSGLQGSGPPAYGVPLTVLYPLPRSEPFSSIRAGVWYLRRCL
uniref:FERM domain-containing protein n=1 Tax=Heterorhabditis bacteriophora TaxID=37862 RepID=A0A1I7W8X2_HETBA